jgi:hypothetical protein
MKEKGRRTQVLMVVKRSGINQNPYPLPDKAPGY